MNIQIEKQNVINIQTRISKGLMRQSQETLLNKFKIISKIIERNVNFHQN